MTLDDYIAAVYAAEVKNGNGLDGAKQNFKEAVVIDSALRAAVQTRLSEVQAILAARPNDFITSKVSEYLQEALNG